MGRFRLRPLRVEAHRFDGTAASASAMADWADALEPPLVVRRRIEYRGWADRAGHLELEVRGIERQLMSGDWLVVGAGIGPQRAAVLDDEEFRRRFAPAGPTPVRIA